MNYLDRFDEKVRSDCCVLTPSQKLRTGMRTMGDIKRASAFISNPLNRSAFGRSNLVKYPLDDIERIILESKVKTPSGIRAVNLDKGDEQVIRPAPDDGDASSWSGTERTFDSPPLSAVAEEEIIGQNIQQQVALYERGIIDARQLEENVRQLRGDIRQEVEVAVDEQMRPYAVREEIVGREAPRYVAQPYSEREPLRGMEDLPAEEGYVPPEYVPPEAEYRPPVRRPPMLEVETGGNRGSGSGRVNPNAPGWAAGGYDRGGSREAYDPSREMRP
jgi:hypothetical protein